MTDDIKDIFDNFEKYFSEKRKPLEENSRFQIFDKMSPKGIVYRKGIKVGQHDGLIYDYNFYEIDINESRVITSGFELESRLRVAWKSGASVNMLERLLKEKESLELNTDWQFDSWIRFSDNWLHALKDRIIVPKEYSGNYVEDLADTKSVMLPDRLCNELHKQFKDKLTIRNHIVTGKQIGRAHV